VVDADLAADPRMPYGFLLHDVGKLGIPAAILDKPGPLDSREWQVMHTHPLLGTRIMAGMPFLGPAVDVIRCHHERWDGHGYPHGLRGAEIPLAARIFAVCDAFDAITSARPTGGRSPSSTPSTRSAWAPARSSTRRWWRRSAPSR
jgi:HD-GYP domain-containing protein (c-di-GMP phosphodiesterase class II)